MSKYTLSLMILLNCIFPSAFSQINSLGIPFSKYYPSQEYAGGIQNWKITQSNTGLIYVANNFGLLEFDGKQWERYTLATATKCRYVYINGTGTIYVAGQGNFGYFTSNTNGILQFVSLKERLPEELQNFDETWRIYERNEELIFCTFEDIFIFNNKGEFKHVINPDFDPESFHMVNHEIFVNQYEKGLSTIQAGELKPYKNGSFFMGQTITAMLPFYNDQVLVCTLNNGVFISTANGFRQWSPQNTAFFEKALINHAIRLNNGQIAIGTQNEGLIVINNKEEIELHLNKGTGIENRTVLSVFEDIQGNLWLGHNNGISMIELSLPFRHVNEQIDLPGTGYDALLHNDTLYYGTNNGLFYRSTKAIDSPLQLVENSTGQVYSIMTVGNETIMGHHNGAYSIKNGKAELIAPTPGTWTFLELSNYTDYVLQGNYKGLSLFKKTPKGLRFVRKLEGFSESSRVMQQDRNGDIWMTHGYKGVYKIKLNPDLKQITYQYYGVESGLPSTYLINVWKINNRLVFSTEEGFYRYDDSTDSFVPDDYFNEFLPLESPVNSLNEDPVGNIFYSSLNEIGVFEKRNNGTYQKYSNIFNRLDLLLNDDLQKLITLEANQVLFAAKEGFIHFNNKLPKTVDHQYVTLINTVRISSDEDSLTLNAKYDYNTLEDSAKSELSPTFAYKNNAIQLSFSAPFIEGQNKTKYQFWLENAEPGFSEWTDLMVKEYTHLKEGTYTFHVKAKNIYNEISEEAQFTFTISPPWYRTTFAYSVYFVLGASFLGVVFFGFENRYKKKTEILTEEKEKEINRIDTELKSSEEEIERLKNERLEAKIELQNKELATSTMHLINKNSFISHVKSNLNTITKRSKNQEIKQEINKIIHNIDKNIASDNDWEHFSIHFDQVHGDFTKRLKDDYPTLSPQEMKLSAYLRMNLSTKEIAHLLNISVRGAEIARYRLRKKLDLERAENLQEFILKY